MDSRLSYYENPVNRGFYPDPSVIRVGDDFYMVNSSFQYFPAIPVSHSRDLVHWELIGHAVSNPEWLDLSDLADSHGIWACDISYRDGLFTVYGTLRLNNPVDPLARGPLRRQIMTTAERAEGPWSKPVFIDVDNIDPSPFIDDDGKKYLVISPGITIVPLEQDGFTVCGEPVQVWPGTGNRCPEGPHLLKKDGWYYAILAEGGTGWGHCVSAGRAKNLYGPYESSPYNPVLFQKNPDAPIQRSGHGKLVQTQNGDWWMCYLCGRPNGGKFTTLGRETALDPVQWTDDGWFTVNSLEGPSSRNVSPDLPQVAYPARGHDDFDDCVLSLDWEFVRNPDSSSFSLNERPGYYRIWTGYYGLNSIHAKNTLLRREKEHAYSAETMVDFKPSLNGPRAGLVCYYGVHTHIRLELGVKNSSGFIQVVENNNDRETCRGSIPWVTGTSVRLRVDVRFQARVFFARVEGEPWTEVGRVEDCSFLSDEGTLEGKHHTGTMVGMFAHNGMTGERIAADFDYFTCR